jgi:cation/acetate symporter
MAHDSVVGVDPQGEHVPPQEQVKAARIATVIVGAMAIAIGIAAKGQNVAHLVAPGIRGGGVGELPVRAADALLEALQHGRHRARHDRRTFTAIGLVLVSPNMTYPKAVKAAAQKVVEGAPARVANSSRTSRPHRPAAKAKVEARSRARTRTSRRRRSTSIASRTTRRAWWVSRSRCSSCATPASYRSPSASSR